MDMPDFKNKWPLWKSLIQKQHPEFTDDDLLYQEGKEEELLQRLQDKKKQTREEIYKWLHVMG